MPCIKSVYVFNLGWILKLKKKKGENILDSKKVCVVEKKEVRRENADKKIVRKRLIIQNQGWNYYNSF